MIYSDFYYQLSHNIVENDCKFHVPLIKYLLSHDIVFATIMEQLIKKLVKNNQVTELQDLIHDNIILNRINLYPYLFKTVSHNTYQYLVNVDYMFDYYVPTLLDGLYYMKSLLKQKALIFNNEIEQTRLFKLISIKLIDHNQSDIFEYVYRRLQKLQVDKNAYLTIVDRVIASKNLYVIELVLSQPLVPHTLTTYQDFLLYAKDINNPLIINIVEQYQPVNLPAYIGLKQFLLKHDHRNIENIIKNVTDISFYETIIDELCSGPGLYRETRILIINIPINLLLDVLSNMLVNDKLTTYQAVFDIIIDNGNIVVARLILKQLKVNWPKYKDIFDRYLNRLIKTDFR